MTVVAVAAVPDILPGYAGKGGAGSGSSAASLLEERVESLSTAAGVLAGLLESCEAEAHATVAPIVLLLLLGLVAAPNTQLTAAATRALQQAVATTKDATSLRSAAVHTIEQLQKALGERWRSCWGGARRKKLK